MILGLHGLIQYLNDMKKESTSIPEKVATISDSDPLSKHIDQSGITYGPRKLDIFRRACQLRGVTQRTSSKIARVKIFDPCGSWTWFVSAWNPKTDDCFGLVLGAEREFGTFSLRELSSIKGPLGIGLEVDTWFEPRDVQSISDGH